VVMLPELDNWWMLDFSRALSEAGLAVSVVPTRLNQSDRRHINLSVLGHVESQIRKRYWIDYELIREKTAWQLPLWEER